MAFGIKRLTTPCSSNWTLRLRRSKGGQQFRSGHIHLKYNKIPESNPKVKTSRSQNFSCDRYPGLIGRLHRGIIKYLTFVRLIKDPSDQDQRSASREVISFKLDKKQVYLSINRSAIGIHSQGSDIFNWIKNKFIFR